MFATVCQRYDNSGKVYMGKRGTKVFVFKSQSEAWTCMAVNEVGSEERNEYWFIVEVSKTNDKFQIVD